MKIFEINMKLIVNLKLRILKFYKKEIHEMSLI